MNRRQYIQAVGASVALPLTAGQATARGDGEKRPVYYTVSVPEIDTQILHISIPKDLLNESNYLWSVSESKDVALNISRETTDEEWGLVNIGVQTDHLERVSVGGVEATRWDTVEFEQIALLVSGDADHSYLNVVGGGYPVHLDAVENFWTWESCGSKQVRVETTDQSDIEIQSIRDGDLEYIPVFPMTPSYFAQV